MQLELKYLSHLTGDDKYWVTAERPMQYPREVSTPPSLGILPIFLSPETGQFYVSDIRLGSRGDSYYEYLVKQYLQTNRTEAVYRAMYEYAFDGIKAGLVAPGTRLQPPLVHTVELVPQPSESGPQWRKLPKQDHLVCFLGGTMMLGAAASLPGPLAPPRTARNASRAALEDWRVGHELTRACVDTYARSRTGLGAEIVFFLPPGVGDPEARDWMVKRARDAGPPPIDARNILRPETVESLYIAYQLTGDVVYREWGWAIFEAFRRHCRVDGGAGGYAGIDDVDAESPEQIDRMETFWLSETLKYLYLLYSPRDTLSFDAWVFNTEAHPLPVFTPARAA